MPSPMCLYQHPKGKSKDVSYASDSSMKCAGWWGTITNVNYEFLQLYFL